MIKERRVGEDALVSYRWLMTGWLVGADNHLMMTGWWWYQLIHDRLMRVNIWKILMLMGYVTFSQPTPVNKIFIRKETETARGREQANFSKEIVPLKKRTRNKKVIVVRNMENGDTDSHRKGLEIREYKRKWRKNLGMKDYREAWWRLECIGKGTRKERKEGEEERRAREGKGRWIAVDQRNLKRRVPFREFL